MAEDILQRIVAAKRIEIEQMCAKRPIARLERLVADSNLPPVTSFSNALRQSPSGIIAEFKRRSPSKGWINENGNADIIPLSYQQNGAAALSILTDREFFGGDNDFILRARQAGVSIPVLYKNFVIDEYMVLQARLCGASAVLLIAACLSQKRYRQLAKFAHSLSLETLLEIHEESELDYVDAGADAVGVNNRRLASFVTNVEQSFRLAGRLPADILKVSESGISDPATVRRLRNAGFNGFLIGECFMRSENPGNALADFIQKI